MARTKRTQNKCKSCSYTWYPRGKNLSHKCPKCGSEDVGYAKGGLVLGAIVIAGIVLFGGDKTPEAPKESAAHTAPVDVAGAIESVPSVPLHPAAVQPEAPVHTNARLEPRGEAQLEGRTEQPAPTSVEETPAKPVTNELY